jgi:hypothetical protein
MFSLLSAWSNGLKSPWSLSPETLHRDVHSGKRRLDGLELATYEQGSGLCVSSVLQPQIPTFLGLRPPRSASMVAL